MIIIENPVKDTYVTDIQTSLNNGLYSNVGQSSTIDLFKITGENNKTVARGLLEFLDNPGAGSTINLTDSFQTSKTFEFVLNLNDVSGQNIGVIIDNADLSITLNNLITEINNSNELKISSYILYSGKILLKQSKIENNGDVSTRTGEYGETNIIVNESLTSNITYKNFKRFEHSAGLIKFNLQSLKETHLPDILKRNNSVFRDSPKFSASIKLMDVGKSSTRAKNFSLSLDVLNNDFKEGLGKDVIHFSDLDDANFKVLNSENNTNWTNEGIVSENDLFLNNSFNFNDFLIETGKEDIEFDITDYLHEFFKETASFDKENFVIHFPINNLFDDNTYFVKRFGSRNLKNKQFIPQLILKIDDREIENIILDKKRYFDNQETFYLLNIKGNKSVDFIENNNVKLKFKFVGDNDENIYSNITPILGTTIYNYKGEEITGIKKFIVNDTIISQINSDSKFNEQLNKLDYVKIELEYFYENITDPSIISTIKKQNIKFYLSETEESELNLDDRNIRVSIDILQKELKSNDTISNLKVSFIDINKQYKSVNTSIDLYSEDMGDITYEMYDVDSGNILIKDENEYTQLRFNGKHYNLNLFSSSNFKNKRINFVFKYKDPLSGLYKKVSNDNTILRFV